MTQAEAMILSVTAEAAAAFALAMAFAVPGPWRAPLAAALATSCSHPIVWPAALALFPLLDYWAVAALVEAFAVLIEAPFYAALARMSLLQGVGFSAAANAFSVTLGWIWTML